MNKPTLSVVMANYNHAHFLPQALNGILSQSYLPLEIIIIDDGSTDNSISVIESFAQKSALIHFHRNNRNRGVVYSVNIALEMVKGDYLNVHSADDWILPGLYEKSINLLRQYPSAALCSSKSEIVDAASGKKIILYLFISQWLQSLILILHNL